MTHHRAGIDAAAYSIVARVGYARHRRSHTTDRFSYAAMRRLFGASGDAFDELAARARADGIAAAARAGQASTAEPAPGIAAGVRDEATAALDRDGLYVFDNRLGEATCAELRRAAEGAQCEVATAGGVTVTAFDPDHAIAPRYDVPETAVLELPAVQDLVADASLVAIARSYLRTEPIQDLVAMWWSVPYGDAPSAEAAQLFHFDLDRLNFLKLFVYLTDVDDDTGPHVYVPRSHRDLPASLGAPRRYRDDEVETHYPSGGVSMTGPAGTMFLADTRGLHKGLPPATGRRLVLQLQYSTSLFGAPYVTPTPAAMTPKLEAAVADHPYTYQRFLRGLERRDRPGASTVDAPTAR